MEDSVNYAEYTVTKKAEGSNLRKRILLIAAYFLLLFLLRTKLPKKFTFTLK